MTVQSNQDIGTRVRAFLAEQLPLWTEDVTDAEALDRYGLDSTAIVMLFVFLEETFGIEIQDEDLTYQNMSTVGAIARLVAAKQQARA